MPKLIRRQLFVDPKVQGTLILRLLGYWGVTIITTIAMVFCWRVAISPPQPLVVHFRDMSVFFGPALVASLFLPTVPSTDVRNLLWSYPSRWTLYVCPCPSS